MTSGGGWSAASSLVRTDAASRRRLVGTTARVRAGAQVEPVTSRSRFDLASLTKVFTALTVLTLVDDGLLDLDAPVRERLDVPATRTGASARHLLTHTAGLRASSVAWRTAATPAGVLDDVLGTAPETEPGQMHLYSCLGFVLLGLLVEEVTSTSLDRVVLDRVAVPLGAAGLSWGPVRVPNAAPGEVVATEPGTPTGHVHDELAAALARPVGNAGLFGTLDDVARLAEVVRRRGAFGGRHVVSEARWHELVTPDPVAVRAGAPYGQALGLRRGCPTMSVTGDQVGHTGFTGTSFVVDLSTGGYAVLLTNRVHGGRDGTGVDDERRALAGCISP
ncbi:serine hydrolase domain-containing protein [Oerskovia flava]|uniref:serine hydrolase domain-containing protein n=1 Tax=Oerskovia flava TaxID=2986422 RepID=UPI00223F43D3|nr:serine hydrolase domain-containing protein [Oerskovia sp. JB1-3-2]